MKHPRTLQSQPDTGPVQPSSDIGRPFDLDHFRHVYPDRWRAFLHAQFRSIDEVAVFFDVTDEAARKWWHGIGGPRGAQVSIAFTAFPSAALKYLRAG